VQAHNGWLVYGPPLHRAREFGLHNKLFDLLDEQARPDPHPHPSPSPSLSLTLTLRTLELYTP